MAAATGRPVTERQAIATVHFACNDDNGLFTGECCALRFEAGDYLVALDGDPDPDDGVRLVRGDDFVELFRVRVPVGRWQAHTGNILWDAATVRLRDARRLLGNALELGFQINEATVGGPFADIVRGHS